MLRVLHVASGNLYGGIERILATLAAGAAHAPDMRAEFAYCHAGRSSDELARLGAAVHMLAPVRARNPLSIHRGRQRLAALLAREPFDVVVFHGSWLHAMFAVVARRQGRRVAFWLHSVTSGRHWTERWARRTPPDLLLCGSRDVARTAGTLFPAVPPVVYYAPMPIGEAPERSARDDVRGEQGAGPDETIIVQVGRMDPLKGQMLLIDALARLRDVPRWSCWLVGGVQVAAEQAYLDGLRTRVAAHGLEARVRFLGQRSDVSRVLAAADVFCQPNQWSEGLSIAWMEAGQAALPIVTMDLGTAREFVGESAGLLVPPGDVAALAAALERLVRDPALRRRLGDGASRRVLELCEPARQIPRLAELLSAVTGRAAAMVPPRPSPSPLAADA